MLKALLAIRFKLTAHTESRPLRLYALVMAESDGKMGATPSMGTECAPITIPAELDRRRLHRLRPRQELPPAGRPHGDALWLDARGRHGVGSSNHDGAVRRPGVGLRRPPGDPSHRVDRRFDSTSVTRRSPRDAGRSACPPTALHFHRAAGTARVEARLATRAGRRVRHRSGGAADTGLTLGSWPRRPWKAEGRAACVPGGRGSPLNVRASSAAPVNREDGPHPKYAITNHN